VIFPWWLGLACLLVLPGLVDGRTHLAARFAATFLAFPFAYRTALAGQRWLYTRADLPVRPRVFGNMALWFGLAGFVLAITLLTLALLPGP
jgi:hypothetical protein